MNSKSSKTALLVFCLVLVVSLNACSLTSFTSSWGLDNSKASTESTKTTFIPIETEQTSETVTSDYFLEILDGEQYIEAKGSPKEEPKALKTITESKQLTSDGLTVKKDDTSVLRVCKGGSLNLSDFQIISTSKSTDDMESRFYGVNAAILCEPRSSAAIYNTEIACTEKGATGIFSYGNNAIVNLVSTTITTKGANSKGLSSSYNGSIFASKTDITTEEEQSPCLYIGRNGGTINAVGGTLSAKGASSPIVYSCGDMSLTGVKGTSDLSECGVVEGKNSLMLTDCNLKSTGTNGFKLFQSNSGDTISGKTSLNAVAGSISNEKGATFYVTNTNAEIHLQFVTIENGGTLLSAVSDKWGKSPENGGNALLFADCQKISGDVYCDNKSTVDLRVMNGSYYKGAVNKENTAKEVKVTVDATSKWVLTDNCYVSCFTNNVESLLNIEDNGYNIYYDPSHGGNSWLDKRILTMKDGGKIMPIDTRIDIKEETEAE